MISLLIGPVQLTDKSILPVQIYESSPDTLFEIDEQEAMEFGESRYQLMEGKSYEYALPLGYQLEKSDIVKPSNIDPNRGYLHTNIYVGTFETDIWKDDEIVGRLILEIRSVKTTYREDYRRMLEDITQKCTDLLMQQSSIIYQTFTPDVSHDPQTLYQRFAFVDSIIRSEPFFDALHRINSMPVQRWETMETRKNICNIRRANSSVMRQLVTGTNRTQLPPNHSLSGQFSSLPVKINITDKTETTDIPENRFIKYVLEIFMQFCLSIHQQAREGSRLHKDAQASTELLARHLSLPMFKEVSRLDMIPLNSPVLQRKEGYREILQAYLMFDMTASLIWKGGDDVYKGGKRDVAVLYEYWLFFKLLDLMEEVFTIKPRSIQEIIIPTKDGLALTLKQGELKMINGTFTAGNRNLHIEFYYNRTFCGADHYPDGGSWTRNMRPDYTLSIWPEGISQEQAEAREMIVHIHFDAKYKVERHQSLFMNMDLNEEKRDQARGNYKRADLLKMHAYKDAIRRTAGAYILYPGEQKQTFASFHEILPGIGAFAISPAHDGNTGLKEFLLDIVQHFINRASQRELFSYRTFDTFREAPAPILKDPIPNMDGTEHPHITHVFVGYYKNEAHLQWILKNKIYNLRTDYERGSLRLTQETIGARYLLLHGNGITRTNLIFRLVPEGPRVLSKDLLKKLAYPSRNIKPYYIGFSLESPDSICKEFGNVEWDVTKLEGFQKGRNSAKPFVVTVEMLMKGRVN